MKKSNAPGAPGDKARWTSSAKAGIGKALNRGSHVSFTIGDGIINEIYYPREDIACIREMGFVITDGEHFFSEEKKDSEHQLQMTQDGVPAFKITNTCKLNKYKIKKEIIADPFRNTVLQKFEFSPDKNGRYRLYVLLSSHLNNDGDTNTGWVDDYKGIDMLFAQNNELTLALACSEKWLKRSVGFEGVSDGFTDLREHKTMTWEYTQADKGNVILTGEIDISGEENIVLALGFGRNANEAANHAWGSLLDGFESAKKWYIDGWTEWLKTLNNVKGKNYKISAAVLRMNEAKMFPGGIVASMSIPWGEAKGDSDKGGYHLVWPRDLVESAGGFIALKTNNDALRIVNYLMSTQKTDGSWPQNMWLEGSPHWKGKQMDQTALPILLIDRCNKDKAMDTDRMKRYWPVVKKAISYLIKNGPYTQEERWEEEQGYSPFTLAAEIAGLLAAADLAEQNNEPELAQFCLETADYWNDNIEFWTYVTNTPLAAKTGVDGYYLRLNPYRGIPASQLGDKTIDLKNHKDGEGTIQITELVSVDALALVRFGLRAADDPKILNTIKLIDDILKVDTPNGSCWHRYNNDGYGEHENGDPYDGTGIGRAWPLLTGERAHYEIAAGNIDEAKKLQQAMENFAHNGLLSEQIWDTNDIPSKNLYFGRHSGSAMPLTWAHAEYIKLCASIRDKKVFDMPKQTQERYLVQKKTSSLKVWSFSNPCKTIPPKKKLRIQVEAPTVVNWTEDNWKTTKQTPAKDTGIGVYIADIPVKLKKKKQIEFTFFWTECDSWENKNFVIMQE